MLPQVGGEASSADPQPPADSTGSAVDRGAEWFCGGFGAEQPPVLLALARSDATQRWRRCTDLGFVQPFGRAQGATLLVRQQNNCTSLVAVDDAGEERWHAATDPYRGGTYVVGDVVVTTTPDVVGLDAVTGGELWRHAARDGTPIGSTGELLIEAQGAPYDGSAAGPPAPATLRGVDPHSGEAAWEIPIELVSVPAPSRYSPTVGDGVIAITDSAIEPHTTLYDGATGDVLGTHDGVLVAMPEAVVVQDEAGRSLALVDPRTGGRVDLDGTTPVWMLGADAALPSSAGVLVVTEPTTGPAAELRMLDLASGAVRWSVPYREPLARDAISVLVTDADHLVSLDAADGRELWRYRAPTDLIEYAAGTIGDDVIVVMPRWAGAAGSPPPPQPGVIDDCGGTDPATANASCVEDLQDDAPSDRSDDELIVGESADGRIFCVSVAGAEPLFGPVPVEAAHGVRFEQPHPIPSDDGEGDSVLYVFALSAGSPRDLDVLDERGRLMPAGVASSGRLLVVFQAQVGSSGSGPSQATRRVRIVDASGAEVAQVEFPGFSEESGATFEGFRACVEGTGVRMPLPPGGGGGPTTSAVPASTADLRRAWTECADLFISMLRVSHPASDRYFENVRAQYDCEAEAGVFTPITGSPTDPSAHARLYAACALRSPATAALIACLEANGWRAAGRAPGEPFSPDVARRAWDACRGEYAGWVDPSRGSFDRVLATYDCAAAQGWILPILSVDERELPQVRDVQRAC